MRFHQPVSLLTRIKRAALAFDAWLNATLYESGRRAGEGWDRYAEASKRLRVRGLKRAGLDRPHGAGVDVGSVQGHLRNLSLAGATDAGR